MFGAGGGTSAYVEAEDADLLVLWGSNARETHPIFFHHVLQGLKKGTRMWSVDPRRTSTAQWADGWLGLDVGTDIALANAIGREIIHAGLVNEAFVRRATTGFDEYKRHRRALHAGAGAGDHRRRRGPDPRAGARLRHAPTAPRSAGRWASPSTTTPPTTCSR